MKCEDCCENLTSLIYDELDEATALSCHEHLAVCDSCREQYMELVEVSNTLEESLIGSAGTGLGKERIDSILNEARPEVKSIKFPSWIFAVAACLVVGAIIAVNVKDEAPIDTVKQMPMQQSKQESKQENAKMDAKPQAAAEFLEKEIVMEDRAATEKKSERGALKQDKLADAVTGAPAPEEKQRMRKAAADKDIKNSALQANAPKAMKALEEADAVAEGFAASAKIGDAYSPEQLKKMVLEYTKTENVSSEAKTFADELLKLKNDTLKVSVSPSAKGANSSEIKILLRILDNDKNAIDYANIYIHNQKVIRLERVNKN